MTIVTRKINVGLIRTRGLLNMVTASTGSISTISACVLERRPVISVTITIHGHHKEVCDTWEGLHQPFIKSFLNWDVKFTLGA